MDTGTNAVAGPSNLRNSSPRPHSPSRQSTAPHSHVSPTSLFLPPPGPPQFPAYIQSTQDLLDQFHLHDAYDKYVRTFIAESTVAGQQDKGKGKEVVPPPSMAQTPAADGQDADDDDGAGDKGEKKKKNSYKHLIKGVPGKHSLKKDDYLTTLMQAPPKQRVRISEFDSRTQRDAFTVSLEGLKGWNPSALVLESAQAREDRKKRKELKKLAKAQFQAAQSQVPTQQSSPAASTPIQAPVPTSAISTTSFPPSARTPRPGLTPVQIPVQAARVGTPLRTATPTTTPHPLSAPPLTATAVPPTPASNTTAPPPPRGQKRERDELPLAPTNGNGNMSAPVNGIPNPAPQAIINQRAGINSVRPRPLKKARMDSQGVGRDTAPVQQHTPA